MLYTTHHIKPLRKVQTIFGFSIAGIIASVIGFSIFLKGVFYIIAEAKIAVASVRYGVEYGLLNNKNVLASFLAAVGGSDIETPVLPSSKDAESIPVLMYHGIVSKPDGSNVTVETFRDQMFALKKAGYRTITIKEFADFVNLGKPVPDKSFLLTFDDGRKDSYYPVDPILKALDFNAVIFVITGSGYSFGEDGPYYLSQVELKNLLKSGRWELQAHTRNGHSFYGIDEKGAPGHFYSDKLWRAEDNRQETAEEFQARIRGDFAGVYADLKNAFGVQAISFAYPFGDYGHLSRNFPEAAEIVPYETSQIYPVAFYQTWIGEGFTENFPEPGTYLRRRLDVRPHWTPEYLLSVLEAGKRKPIPFSDSFNNPDKNDWIALWGMSNIADSEITLRATDYHDGAAILLNGSYLWQDYSVEASLSWRKGSNVSIFARLRDQKNYLTCDFGPQYATIKQRVRDQEQTLAKVRHLPIANYSSLALGMSVRGNEVICTIGGVPAARAVNVDPALKNGGIGFMVWDAIPGNAEAAIQGVRVDP